MKNHLSAAVRSTASQILAQVDSSVPHHRRIDDHPILEALHWQARTGCPWRYLPSDFPSVATIFRRRAEWLRAGVFDALLASYLAPTEDESLIDATFIEVKSPLPERGWTKIGNGIKLQALCTVHGEFSSVRLSSAGPGEARLAAKLFERIEAPSLLLADAAYDTNYLREVLAQRECRILTTRSWPGRRTSWNTPEEVAYVRAKRWPVERSFAWLKAYAGVATCRARSLAAYGVSLALAIANINSRFY